MNTLPSRFVVAIALAAISISAFGQTKEDPWVGQTAIFTSAAAVELRAGDQVVGKTAGPAVSVIKAQGDWIWVRSIIGLEGWMAKRQVVPLDQAYEVFTARINKNSRDAYAYYGRSIAQFLKGQREAASADIDEAIRLSPKWAAAYSFRGEMRMTNGEYEGALADINEAIRLGPVDQAMYVNAGQIRMKQGDHAKAIANFTKAIELSPQNPQAYLWRGMVRVSLTHEYELALSDLNEALKQQPGLVAAHYMRGVAWFGTGHPSEAVADFDEAIRLGMTAPSVYSSRGMARGQTGDLDGAIEDLTKAIEATSTPQPFVLAQRGIAYVKAGRYAEGIADLKQAGELDSELALKVAPLIEEAEAALANPASKEP
jgi:tetratricopeptide (TPR) repeat protein